MNSPEARLRRRDLFRWRRLGTVLAALLLGTVAVAATADVQLFDANILYTSGVVLPLPSYDAASIAPLTTPAWTAKARPVAKVAADGASLLVVRIPLALADNGSVQVSVVSDLADADPGSLWTIQDPRVVDTTAQGGAIDSVVGPRTITVPSFVVGAQRFAFVLYRSPRNFDSGAATAQIKDRTLHITAQTPASSVSQTITVLRPLVVFVHGTTADNDTWLQFPLWRDSSNEVHGFAAGTLPFDATRISFHWIWNSTGGAAENAATILAQLATAIRDWREATGAAATQADVVTHSFGGFVARQVVQTQPDGNPLAPASQQNFRAAVNWGHGSIHKLITLTATHRGAATANATAYLNKNGLLPGFGREAACQVGSYIDRGALRDQMVLSETLQALQETRVPGHAVAGSGRAALDPSLTYFNIFAFLPLSDKSDGPYRKAGNNNCLLDAVANYVFNLDVNVPPITGTDANNNCSVTPNYDLVVSENSELGLMPAGAATTAADLGLVGVLNHTAIHTPSFGSAAIVQKVSDRVLFLLEQPTTSSSFSFFPAVASVTPTALETRLSTEFDPSWLEFGTKCPAPVYDTTCPAYSSLQVVPSRLELQGPTPAPLWVYGLLGGQWVLAYSPTTKSSTSRNCPITLKSSNTAVASIVTNDVTGAQAVVAAGAGNASITVTVQGAPSLAVPVTVAGGLLGSRPEPCAADATTLCLNDGRFKVQAAWTGPDGRGGAGRATRLTASAGDFWFFHSDNIEVVVKMVDGRSFNSRFWVFAGGLTNVAVTLTVTDMQTGAVRIYTNPQGTAFQPIQDVDAFLDSAGSQVSGPRSQGGTVSGLSSATSDVKPVSSQVEAAPCVADATTLCLNNARFSVRTQWTTPDGDSGFGHAVALTGDTGDFWFFNFNSVEVVVKALNGCSVNSRYWAFAAGLTNVNVVMTVTDTQTGSVRTYTNPQGSPFQPIQDTSSFATCP
jgi:pimeloyl-ACP methyl ester carboxylesterase